MARWLYVTFLVVLSLGFFRAGQASAAEVALIHVTGGIDPAVAEYVNEGIRDANANRSPLIVLKMDTPGGLGEPMDSIVQSVLGSKTPVCVYVAPAGARAASAGAIIALSAPLVAMAPATNMGAATPINGATGGDLGRKIKNDSLARARALAVQRHRPVDWAERVVLKAESVTVDEAIQQHLADVKATDVSDLLRKLDGRKVDGQTLRLAGVPVRDEEMPFRLGLLHLLVNPNTAYLLMLLAIYGLIGEMSHPGAVFPGVTGAIAALLAFYGLSVLSVNAVGLLLIMLAVGLFIGDVVLTTHGSLSLGGSVAFLFGSLMLIRSPLGTVSPYLATFATLVTMAFFLGLISLAIRTRRRPAVMGREAMAGRTAMARTALGPDRRGRVFMDGTLWNAVAAEPVAPGQPVEVTAIEGLTLTVRPVRPRAKTDPNTYAAE